MIWKPAPSPFRAFKKENLKKTIAVSDFIYQLGEYQELRKPSIEVPLEKISSATMQKKLSYLKKCLVTYRKKTGFGRGMAAVQTGIPERFAAVYIDDSVSIIINPRVTKKSHKNYRYSEMCMSISPVIAPVIRPAWIEFYYYDEFGKKKYWNIKDETQHAKLMNRVFQHEIDHMNGVLNIDMVTSSQELSLFSDPSFYESATFIEIK